MTIVVDANVAIAALDPQHLYHRAALHRCLAEGDVAIVNLTRAEALIHPTRAGIYDQADRLLTSLGFRTEVLDNRISDRARMLRASYGNKGFPLIDAVVVALGVENHWPIVTCDSKWPDISEATIEVLTPA